MPGLIVERSGECSRCGACCFEKRCPHFDFKTRLCLIYDRRADYCEECKENHSLCIRWPIYPVLFSKPLCGYHFKVKGTEYEVIRMEMVKKDDSLVT